MKLQTPTTSNHSRHLPQDEALSLGSLLDTEVVKSVLEDHARASRKRIQSCRIGHIRYNPGVSCIVCYQIGYVDDDGEQNDAIMYARCFTPQSYEQTCQKTAQQSWVAGSICSSPVTIPKFNAIIYEFPNDAKITSLRLIAEPGKLAQIIGGKLEAFVSDDWTLAYQPLTCHHLRYKPENRFVARCDINWVGKRAEPGKTFPVILRFERFEKSDGVFDLMKRLQAAFEGNPTLAIPKPLFHLSDKGILALEHVEGAKLSEILRTEEAESAVGRTARTLALLHTYRDSELPVHDTTVHLRKVEQSARWLDNSGQVIRARTEQILRQLQSLAKCSPSGHRGFVHGDFHQGQVLRHEKRDWIIDFNRAYIGETTADIGNFLAQLRVLQIRRRLPNDIEWDQLFLDSYEKASGLVVPKERLKFWTAIGLFELAAKEFRRLKHDWPNNVVRIMEECQATIDR